MESTIKLHALIHLIIMGWNRQLIEVVRTYLFGMNMSRAY